MCCGTKPSGTCPVGCRCSFGAGALPGGGPALLPWPLEGIGIGCMPGCMTIPGGIPGGMPIPGYNGKRSQWIEKMDIIVKVNICILNNYFFLFHFSVVFPMNMIIKT